MSWAGWSACDELVAETLAFCLLALDDHDWGGVTSCLGETVRRDYSSLFGNEPEDLPGSQLAAEWKSTISALDSVSSSGKKTNI